MILTTPVFSHSTYKLKKKKNKNARDNLNQQKDTSESTGKQFSYELNSLTIDHTHCNVITDASTVIYTRMLLHQHMFTSHVFI